MTAFRSAFTTLTAWPRSWCLLHGGLFFCIYGDPAYSWLGYLLGPLLLLSSLGLVKIAFNAFQQRRIWLGLSAALIAFPCLLILITALGQLVQL